MSRRSGNPARRAWQPMEQHIPNPILLGRIAKAGGDPSQVEVWINDLYDCVVRNLPSGVKHLSMKRHDRAAVRNWRHFQQIKNEVCGAEREACELFPAESRLVDQANEYHLWVLPEGERFPLGFDDRQVSGPEVMEKLNAEIDGKGRQADWQPGLTTGAVT